jgi:DSF synthase
MTYASPTLSKTYASQTAADTIGSSLVSRPDMPAFANLECQFDAADRLFWCYLNPANRPSFTEPLLADLHEVQRQIAAMASTARHGRAAPVGWVVLASRVPGIFSLGGDLTVFAQKIRNGDVEGLREYAYSCVQIGYRNASGYDGSAISIGLAQGEALGGGFESLLSCDVIVAERSARFGLPEVLMNLFPGMGAHLFLTRKLGSAQALKMILSGEVFTAEAMHQMGVVDVLVEDGEGEAAVRRYVARNEPRHPAHAAIYKARRVTSPVTLEALRDVTDVWVESAMALTDKDLRRMAHLVAAQDRSRKLQVV